MTNRTETSAEDEPLRPSSRPVVRSLAGAALLLVALLLLGGSAQAAISLPSGFSREAVFSGLNQPTAVRFAADGRVFVAEKGGKILVFDGLGDKEPKLFADLSKPVYDFEDHGLLGLALDPRFDQGRPYVYALYSFNHPLEDPATQVPLVHDPKAVTPAWPSAGLDYEDDECPEGEEVKRGEKAKEELGCEVSGLLVRLTASGDQAAPSAAEPEEDVLLEGWCQQSTTHSIGDLGFGPEGDLFVSGGEGSMFSEPDYGQFGNPCEDPPEPLNPNPVRATAEGGSMRAQSMLRDHFLGERPTLLSGAVLRIDPDSGEGVAGNPFYASSEANARRIVALGFRQPWRFTFSPTGHELFVDNVGNGAYEEIDRIPLGSTRLYNSGWPCYEGPARNLEYAGQPSPSINLCLRQYEAEERGEAGTSAPFYAYPHNGPAVPGDPCQKKITDISGNAFYTGSAYPPEYDGAFFFADAIRGCIYVMRAANGEPEPSTATTFLADSEAFSFPGVDVEAGPGGDIFYVQLRGASGGSVNRIVYQGSEPPVRTYKPPKIKRHPAKRTKARWARFVFSGEAGLRFRCRLDGRKYASCRSPRTYRHLRPGRHSFRVQGLDSARQPATRVTLFRWWIKKR